MLLLLHLVKMIKRPFSEANDLSIQPLVFFGHQICHHVTVLLHESNSFLHCYCLHILNVDCVGTFKSRCVLVDNLLNFPLQLLRIITKAR